MLPLFLGAIFETLRRLILAMSPPDPASCYAACSGEEMQSNQSLGADLFSPARRDPRARFAKGGSGNPKGRPPGIPNPQRRRLDLSTRPVSLAVLLRLVDRKPHLRRSIFAQFFPPAPRRRQDPPVRLG